MLLNGQEVSRGYYTVNVAFKGHNSACKDVRLCLVPHRDRKTHHQTHVYSLRDVIMMLGKLSHCERLRKIHNLHVNSEVYFIYPFILVIVMTTPSLATVSFPRHGDDKSPVCCITWKQKQTLKLTLSPTSVYFQELKKIYTILLPTFSSQFASK